MNFRENVEYVCRQLGLPVEDSKMELAARKRSDMIRIELVPRADAAAVLTSLKSEGYRTGLITDCSYDTAAVWESIPYSKLIDVPVFSCSVGLQKPDPRIYQTAIKRLGVQPPECLYVGDGGSRELTGAAKAGMHAVMLRISSESDWDIYREKWNGPVISSLTEVLALLEDREK